jgi:hypothetical protein
MTKRNKSGPYSPFVPKTEGLYCLFTASLCFIAAQKEMLLKKIKVL